MFEREWTKPCIIRYALNLYFLGLRRVINIQLHLNIADKEL